MSITASTAAERLKGHLVDLRTNIANVDPDWSGEDKVLTFVVCAVWTYAEVSDQSVSEALEVIAENLEAAGKV